MIAAEGQHPYRKTYSTPQTLANVGEFWHLLQLCVAKCATFSAHIEIFRTLFWLSFDGRLRAFSAFFALVDS